MKTGFKFIIGCIVFVGIVCGMYFLSLFLANRIILFFFGFSRVNAKEGTTMYEVYYAYGIHKGTTITYTSTLEEATSFVKAKVFELSQKGIDAHCYYGIRKYRRKF